MATKPATAGETATAEPDVETTLLDVTTAAVKRLIARGKERGYITFDELNAILPPDQNSSEQIEDVMANFSEMGIQVVESEEQEEAEPAAATAKAEKAEEAEEEIDERYLQAADAVDAAVATSLALGVAEPYGSGLGGKLMLLYFEAKSGRTFVVDAMDACGSALDLAEYRKRADDARSYGYGAVCVPEIGRAHV